jgi:hypothetical protein
MNAAWSHGPRAKCRQAACASRAGRNFGDERRHAADVGDKQHGAMLVHRFRAEVGSTEALTSSEGAFLTANKMNRILAPGKVCDIPCSLSSVTSLGARLRPTPEPPRAPGSAAGRECDRAEDKRSAVH